MNRHSLDHYRWRYIYFLDRLSGSRLNRKIDPRSIPLRSSDHSLFFFSLLPLSSRDIHARRRESLIVYTISSRNWTILTRCRKKSQGWRTRERRERRRETMIITAALMTYARPRRRSGDDWQTAVNVRTFCRRASPRFRDGGRSGAADASVNAIVCINSPLESANLSEFEGQTRSRETCDRSWQSLGWRGHATPRLLTFRRNFQITLPPLVSFGVTRPGNREINLAIEKYAVHRQDRNDTIV